MHHYDQHNYYFLVLHCYAPLNALWLLQQSWMQKNKNRNQTKKNGSIIVFLSWDNEFNRYVLTHIWENDQIYELYKQNQINLDKQNDGWSERQFYVIKLHKLKLLE